MCKIIKNYVVVALFVLELVMSFAISIPLENNQSANDNSISNCPRIISRSEWKARKARSTEALDHTPAPYVIVHHGGIKRYCSDEKTCADIVRSYQNLHLDKNGWFDIGYQFVIGEDGNIYEGRGWDLVGAHAPGYNTQSIGICIIGDFTDFLPNEAALKALRSLMDCGVGLGKIRSDYNVIGHRQTRITECPGETFYQYVRNMPNWTNNPKPIH